MMQINFQPRWREELVARCALGALVFELTMGKLHVYFPDPDLWVSSVPSWAISLRPEFEVACHRWCQSQGIPMTVTNTTFVYGLQDPSHQSDT